MNLYNVDATLASDNPLHFRKNFVEKIWKLIITINNKIREEKLQYVPNRDNISIIIWKNW